MKEQTMFSIDQDIKNSLRDYCTRNDRTMSRIVENLIKQFLDNNK